MQIPDPYSLPFLAEAISATFPGVSPVAPLTLIGSGFSSIAVETPNRLVFRIARTPESGRKYAHEAQGLPFLKGRLPVQIPAPEWFAPSAPGLPYGVIGYRKLPGAPLAPDLLSWQALDDVAVQLGEILHSLQQLPLEGFPLRDDFDTRRANWEAQRSFVLPALKESLRAEEYHAVAAWWESLLADEVMRAYQPVIQHGDLWFGNLLVEGTRITGLLDFEEIGAGDPALDFIPQLYLGERFLRRVMEAYQSSGGQFDGGFEHRLARLWGLREFGGLEYAIRYNDQEEFADSLEKIRRGPILSPYGLDGWR